MKKVNINGLPFKVEGDIHFWEVIETWEKHSFAILDKFLNKENVFIDCGTWNGVLSLYASKICKSVIGFEPDQTAYSNAHVNVGINNIENIEIYNVGLSNKAGFEKLYIRNEGDSVSSLIDRVDENYKAKSTKDIAVIQLSKFLEGRQLNIGLIKIDIEGGETIVIPEMEQYIRKNKPNIYVSFHPNWFIEKEKSINYFADLFSEIYNIFDVNFNQQTKESFITGLYHYSHCYIFEAK